MLKFGAQLYTVRNSCKTLEDFSLTLKKVAEIGYKYVQVSGTCEYEPEWLKSELDKNGLECVLTHYNADKIINDPIGTAKAHDIFECKYVGLGYYDFKSRVPEQLIERYKEPARILKENGKYFMYHNHDAEFKKTESGITYLETLANAFAPDEMGFTLDTFWIQAGGGDPADWIRRLKGRVPVIHLKDMAYGRVMSVIGEGNMNFASVFDAAETSGTEYLLVEQDDCGEDDPFDCLKRSYINLKKMGLNEV